MLIEVPKKKSRTINFLKKYAWAIGYISFVLSVFGIGFAVWRYFNPNPIVVIQKETEYHTINVMEPLTETIGITSTVTVTVTRANGTVEDLTKPP